MWTKTSLWLSETSTLVAQTFHLKSSLTRLVYFAQESSFNRRAAGACPLSPGSAVSGPSPTLLAVEIVTPACLLPGQRAIWYIRDGSCAVGRPAWDAGKIEWFRAPRTDAGETADAELRAARGGGCGRKGEGILQAGGRDHPWWGV